MRIPSRLVSVNSIAWGMILIGLSSLLGGTFLTENVRSIVMRVVGHLAVLFPVGGGR